jgi:hypothetical protein
MAKDDDPFDLEKFRLSPEDVERPITLANAALAKAGVDRRQKWHALTELEHLKLVKIRRRSKKSPLVTLLKT